MRKAVGTLLGKSVAKAVAVRGKSGGQAMPGLVVEIFVPGYLGAMLCQLSEGVIVVTGTNGKTTTTKMVVELLEANGLKVLSNPTGSNLTRGIISSVSQQASRRGKLPFDIAVFELDEAYARQFTDVVKPRIVVGLNASRDQLDRFGEVDKVAELIAGTMLAATETIVVNADDKRLSKAVATAPVPITYFGVAPKLLTFFPRDDELVSIRQTKHLTPATSAKPAVELVSFKGEQATYRIDTTTHKTELRVTGQHNFQNAAAALALVHKVLPAVPAATLVKQLSEVKPAFGRGQTFRLKNGTELQLNLVKNPASFRQGLASYAGKDRKLVMAINDRVADSRDMSWLWDVDFSLLTEREVLCTTGSRAVDMALRLTYDDIKVPSVEPDIERALSAICKLSGDKVVFASYTAMLKAYALLDKKAGKEL